VTHKKKKKGEEGGLLREREKWAGGPAGLEREVRSFSFFFLFSNSFQIQTFLIQIHSKLFTKFYKPFRPHTSNQKPCIAK
jgi:hypothetical protein